MDRIQDEMTENGRFLRLLKSSSRSLRTVDHFQNLMNYTLRMTWSFCHYFAHKKRFIEKISEILTVWIHFRLVKFNRLFQNFDKLQFKNVRIFWFLFNYYSPNSCWDIKLTKIRRSGWVDLNRQKLLPYTSEKNFSRFARS